MNVSVLHHRNEIKTVYVIVQPDGLTPISPSCRRAMGSGLEVGATLEAALEGVAAGGGGRSDVALNTDAADGPGRRRRSVVVGM